MGKVRLNEDREIVARVKEGLRAIVIVSFIIKRNNCHRRAICR